MKKETKYYLLTGFLLLVLFAVFTAAVQNFDVRLNEATKTEVGFGALNFWFHKITGVNMLFYHITDWLGLVPIFICFLFGALGFIQLMKRRSVFKVDCDILLLGVYYIIVIFFYLTFETIPINYRPILIEGRLELSYPSSTALLVISVIPTLVLEAKRRLKNQKVIKIITFSSIVFAVFIVIGRLISGVHWLTDIIGSLLFSGGLYSALKATMILCCKDK
ncbi:MAG: phosphatase PAP2 family protein [Oscillospiraceae bacterium]|nr:phosphatase PAP2 family protein [Oscillospiraceae bacterium]